MNAEESRIMKKILEIEGIRIAVVGASPKKERPVFMVMSYLLHEGYTLFPVNPAYPEEEILGLHCVASLKDLDLANLDVAALFISSSRQDAVLKELLESGASPVVWFQPGAENGQAEEMLRSKGFTVLSGYCLMAERRAREKRKKA